MQLKVVSLTDLEECSRELGVRLAAPGRELNVAPGDVVLYRTLQGGLAPARLVRMADDGGWLAQDARNTHGLIYLDPETITSRLPRPELVGEAA